MQQEPILTPNPKRFVLFPIKHDDVWEMYKKAEASFWTAEEIDLNQSRTFLFIPKTNISAGKPPL